ncbi:MAG TPA: IS110 family transposase [Thiobacillus sp.]|jgi:transposase|nr:MAG: IS110 family transposase [Hydrogenophilales bacterium 16-64-40]OZA32132.1 MAG: IS110 family transposase [Hydrogenophilales bacterium 17-64-65]HQT34363.1 IS110 family transposase [Thiobacillus sp.]HQT72263.1 IS110 family transposase [Thiobacillus sp.]
MRFCGIDLHSNNSVVVVTDETDKVLLSRRCPNDLSTILTLLAPHRDELTAVVVESTYNWYWLVDGLMAEGYAVRLANTVAMKRYDGLKHSDDETDAAHLAHLLRLGILPTGYIHPPAERALRDLARKRVQLVRSRTQHVLAVENILARSTGSRPSAAAIKRLAPADIGTLGLAADVALAVQANLAVIATLNLEIGRLEARLLEGAKLRPDYVRLKSIPGIGEVLAIIIMLETGDVTRFARVGNFASYARCVDSARYSNGKKKGEGNTKNGNAYLVWAFIEAANFARRFNDEARRFFERKKAKTNSIVATKALAHKLARASYHMLKEGQPFDVKRCFA